MKILKILIKTYFVILLYGFKVHLKLQSNNLIFISYKLTAIKKKIIIHVLNKRLSEKYDVKKVYNIFGHFQKNSPYSKIKIGRY